MSMSDLAMVIVNWNTRDLLRDCLASVYANRGVIRARQGKSDDAQTDFKKAIELDPALKNKLEPLMTPVK